MNLPNKITLTRIFMIPVFIAVFYCGILSPWCFLASAVVFLGAALTDALDGHIARSRHLVTDLGKFLDPIADKVLVSTALIVLLTVPTAFTVDPFDAYGLIVAGVLVALVLARELIVSGFRIIAAGKRLVLAADKLGKIKTVFQDLSRARRGSGSGRVYFRSAGRDAVKSLPRRRDHRLYRACLFCSLLGSYGRFGRELFSEKQKSAQR